MPNWKKVITSGSDAALNSLLVTNGITGSLLGTASYATTASYALTASYYGGSILSASYALTASYVNPLVQNVTLTGSILMTGSINKVDYINFTTGSDQPQAIGRLGWDDGNGTLNLGLKGGNVNLQLGQEMIARVFNADLVPLTDGMIVYISGSQGNRIAVKRAVATSDALSANTLGMVTEPISIGAEGFITTQGVVNGLNTSALTPGAILYLSSSAGEYTSVKPTAPIHTVIIGYVQRSHATVGSIYVKIDNGYELGELHDVIDNTTTSSYGDLLVKSGSVWTNSKQLTGSYGLTGSLNATSFTGSLLGTASYASQALSSSYADSTSAVAGTINYVPKFTSGTTIGNSNMYATSSRIGIGTLTPKSLLHVAGVGYSDESWTSYGFFLGDISAGATYAWMSGDGISSTNSNLSFATNATERMRITHAGNVGIGTTNPTLGNLQVNGNVYATSFTGSLLGTASYASQALSSSYALTASYWNGTVTSASYALTASYVLNAISASYALTSSTTTAIAGTTNYISKFTSGNTLGNSLLYDNSTNVGIGTTSPAAKLHIVAPGALITDIGFKVRNSADTGDILNAKGNGNVQVGVGGISICRTDTPNGSLLGTMTYQTNGVMRIALPLEISGVYGRSGYDNSQVALDLSYAYSAMRCYGGASNTGFTFNTIAATTGTYFARMQNGANDLLTILTAGNVGISNSSPTYKLDVSGSARISGAGNTSVSSSLVVYGSGSTQPVFTVQGSQGELFSVTDSLSGSLFSVNDISGLPILEVFSDNTTLMGSYQAPSLNTTIRTTTIAGNNVIYSVPTSSYNGAWFEYVATSASNARSGQIMSVCSSNTIRYTETTTTDIGTTTGLNFMVMITGSNFALTGSTTTAGWTVKTIVRSI